MVGVPDPNLAAVVLEMFERYASGFTQIIKL